jgi:hypothetical protein
MSRASDGGRVLAGLTLLIPVLAMSGVTVGVGPAPAATPVATPAPSPAPAPVVRPGRAEPPRPTSGLYQIRCWQHGRLLFEDSIRLPADASVYGIRLAGVDRNGKPMYVAETDNATCLVRNAPDDHYWPR